jgi:hypothetical protein
MKMTDLLSLGAALSLIAIGGVCHGANQISGSEDGLVAYWRFDEDAGDTVRDVSGGARHGKIKGDVKRVKGRVGNAIHVNGEKGCGVVVADAPGLNPTAAITVEAWIKPDKLKREAQFEIVNKASDQGPGYRFGIAWGGGLRFLSGHGYGKEFWAVTSNAAMAPVTRGIWHHVASTYDGQVYRLYLDGVEVASKSGPAITINRKALTIGSYSQGYAYVFNGAIDEVKVYNRAKSAAEIFRAAQEL